MPNPDLSAAILEARAICPVDVFEIETLEINHPEVSLGTPYLELAFVIDTTSSMATEIVTAKALAAQVAANLADDFVTVRFALVQFKDEDNTSVVSSFTGLQDFQDAVDTLVASGGGDSAENGYGAIKLACESLPWTAGDLYARAIFLITDAASHERGATQAQALAALAAESVVFCYGFSGASVSSYDALRDATAGLRITASDSPTVSQELSDHLRNAKAVPGEGSIYLVNDPAQWMLPLELGGDPVLFQTRGFKLQQSAAGENGLQNLSIAIDDMDRKVSKYLAKAKTFNTPIELTFRVYLSTDLTQPQNNPPLTLYVSSVSNSPQGLVAVASTIDVVNAPFPNAYYTLDRFPLS